MGDEQIDAMIEEIKHVASKGRPEAGKPAEPLIVTDKAAEKMKSLLKEKDKEGWGIRILVTPGGCAGFRYGMDFARKPQKGDDVLELRGVRVFVDAGSKKFLSGVTVDYVETLEESGFKFDNPNAKSGCGCGKSFK